MEWRRLSSPDLSAGAIDVPRGTFVFECEQWLAAPPAELFPFFGDARNLESLTPSWLNFRVLTPAPITMGVGTLIDYKLRVRGIPLRWRTRINAWGPPYMFVDEQLRGPYRMWVHTHTFEPHDGGTRCRDRVHYAVSGGAIVNRLFVRRDMERIFAFRRRKLADVFGGHA